MAARSKKKAAAKKKRVRWTCRIDRVVYLLVPVKPAKKRVSKKRAVASKRPKLRVLSSRESFARIVERATQQTAPWHPHGDKALILDVYGSAAPYLEGMTFEAFKRRLVAERFPLDRIDLPEVLGAERAKQNDLFGRGPYALRKGVSLG